MFNSTFKRTAIAAAVAMTLSGAVYAQDTSSNLRGTVATESGEIIANATIQLRDERTGTVRTYTTNDQGAFSARGLNVGGPYTIVAEGPNGRRDIIENIFLTLGDSESVRVVLESDIETIEVTGTATSNSLYGSNSPAANFNLQDLENLPAINRDLKDIVRVDPRVYIDRSFGDGIQCVGASPRFNSLTVDGVRMNDNFGLNSNGYPTERMPFSYDAIEQVAVEFAPFDVQYGGFTACNINAVTKSGSNEFHGGIFYDYTNESLRGDELEGDKFEQADFDEDRYGFTLGGPIIEDTLFFFASYEKFEGVDIFNFGPANSGAGTVVNGVSQAQLDLIRQTAQEVYGYDVGSPISSSPVEDEKILFKLDWQINDFHRASVTYNYNEGASLTPSDGGNTREYEFSNHYYNRGAEFTSYVGQLYSDWTDRFSTEIRVGYSELDNSQVTVGPKDIADFQIDTQFDHDNDGSPSSATVYFGADDSRQANDLYYDTTFFKLAGTYFIGDHVIYGGFEREELDIFNMFVQHSAGGEIDFDSLEDFLAGNVDTYYYGSGTGTNNPRDAAGDFKYATNTAYIQDEYYYAEKDMTFTFGLRYDWYSSDDFPTANQKFLDRYGFTNASNLDGQGLLQPRFGVNWNVSPKLEVRGGIGLYSGGNPNVWLANNYQQDGISQTQVRLGDFNLFEVPLSGEGRPGYDAPQELVDRVTNADNDSSVNVLDPNFEIPNEWKYALGATYTFEDNYILMTDIMYTIRQDEAFVKNIAVEQVGQMVDGRPIYDEIEPGRSEDLMLTNLSEDTKAFSFSTALSKKFDFGLSGSLAYAYTESEDGNPMTSSVAFSNYANFATDDFNNPSAATSNYEIPHRFTLRLTYQKEFFDGLNTTVTLFGSANKGRPYSYVFRTTPDQPGVQGVDIADDRQLLYVPTGADDPNVVFGPDFDQQAFFTWLQESGVGKFSGGTAERNAFYSSWWQKLDLHISQELPGLMDGHTASIFFTIDNLTNLLNDDWGVLYQAGFPQYQEAVSAYRNEEGQYVFDQFLDPSIQGRVSSPSLWQARIGIEYKF